MASIGPGAAPPGTVRAAMAASGSSAESSAPERGRVERPAGDGATDLVVDRAVVPAGAQADRLRDVGGHGEALADARGRRAALSTVTLSAHAAASRSSLAASSTAPLTSP